MTCPYCGHDASDQDFLLEEDVDAMMNQVREAAFDDIDEYFGQVFKDMERHSGGIIKVKTSRRRPRRRSSETQHDDLLRAILCDLCERPYAVHGPAFFCPDCGGGNLQVHLERENELLLETLGESDQLECEGSTSARIDDSAMQTRTSSVFLRAT